MSLTVEVARAGFWRRACAFMIDGLAVGLLLTLIGLALFEPTDERVRVSPIVGGKTTCTGVDPQQVKLPLPTGFKLTSAQHCTTTFLGRMVDRNLVLTEVTRSDSGSYELTYTRSLTYPVNGHRQTTDAIKLDNFWIFLLAAYLLLAEWRLGATLGKKILGVRVRSVGGGPLGLGQTPKRLLVQFIPFSMFALTLFGTEMSTLLLEHTVVFIALCVAWVVLCLVFLINFIRAVRAGDLPWHDRWAQTEVVGSPRVSASPQPSGAA